MTQADRALHLLRSGYDPHSAPGWSRTFGDNYGSVIHFSDGSQLVRMNHRPPHVSTTSTTPFQEPSK